MKRKMTTRTKMTRMKMMTMKTRMTTRMKMKKMRRRIVNLKLAKKEYLPLKTAKTMKIWILIKKPIGY